MIPRHISVLASVVFASFLLAGAGATMAQTGPEEPTLYNRLGGLAPISVVVSDFIDVMIPDPVLNKNPAINAARKRVPGPYLKYHVTAMMCEATGGPCVYQGRGMKESHAHLNITEQEWDRMLFLFKAVLEKHQVPPQETKELLEIVGSTKEAIVSQ